MNGLLTAQASAGQPWGQLVASGATPCRPVAGRRQRRAGLLGWIRNMVEDQGEGVRHAAARPAGELQHQVLREINRSPDEALFYVVMVMGIEQGERVLELLDEFTAIKAAAAAHRRAAESGGSTG